MALVGHDREAPGVFVAYLIFRFNPIQGCYRGRSRRIGSNGKIVQDTRLYITSPVFMAGLLGPVMRSHWTIENGQS